MDDDGARAEAARCLDCWGTVLCDSRIAECTLCGRCVAGCPANALRLSSGAGVDGEEWVHGDVAEPDTTWLVADEERCVRCGLCAERCPVGCLDQLALEEDRRAHG